MTSSHKTKQTNPVGMVLTWNYVDRMGSEETTANPNKVEKNVIINSVSLKSMSTNKGKSAPAGTFEFRLAPTFNWVTRITVGSWCVLLMSPEQDISATTNVAPGFVDPKTFKMLGRIDSVRVVVSVDQTSGARTPEYVVQGQDWGSVFDTTLYLDTIARNNNLEANSAVGHAARLLFDQVITDWVRSNGLGMPTCDDVVKSIIQLWGDPLAAIEDRLSEVAPDLLISSQSQFQLPLPVALFMRLTSKKGVPSVKFAPLINVVSGRLTKYDTYSGDTKEAFGFPDPRSLYGMHSFWQVLMDNSNAALNEMIADVRFEGSNPKLTLYKRIKPFVSKTSFKDDDLTNVISRFSDVRKINIPIEEVLNINAGTNWRDKINFVEVLPQPNLNQTNYSNAVKLNAQTKDLGAFERDGFKPLIEKIAYMPYKDNKSPAPLEATKWKTIIREWYFNTHNMLNGAVTFVGQQQYIQVGDNIEIDSAVFGAAPFNKAHKTFTDSNQDSFLLAHVENVSHQFTVGDDGARSFFTTVQFSRGIIADANGKTIDNAGSAVDKSATILNDAEEKNIHDSFGWSGESDPDTQKLKGT